MFFQRHENSGQERGGGSVLQDLLRDFWANSHQSSLYPPTCKTQMMSICASGVCLPVPKISKDQTTMEWLVFDDSIKDDHYDSSLSTLLVESKNSALLSKSYSLLMSYMTVKLKTGATQTRDLTAFPK